MKRIVIITHGILCEGFKSSMEIITGSSDGIDTISLSIEESIEMMTEKVQMLMNSYAADDQIMILTDIAIGTTTKCVFPLFEERNFYLICGVNLPLLLSLSLTDLGDNPYDSISQIVQESHSTIMFVNEQIANG